MRGLIGVAVCALVWSQAVIAGEEVLYAPAPTWIGKPIDIDASSLKPSDPVFLVWDVYQRVAPDAGVTLYTDSAIRIDSQEVRQQVGQLQFPWDPARGNLTVHKIEILRGNERIDVLAGGKRFEVIKREAQLEKLQINGILTATMTVEGLQIGDVLRMQTSVTAKEKAIGEHAASVMALMPYELRPGNARVELSWPSDMKLNWRAYYEGVSATEHKEGGHNVVRIAGALPKAPDLPADAPPRFTPLPVLDFSTFASWADVSITIAPFYQTEGLIAAGSPLAAEIAKIAAKTADPRQRTALALRFVQDEIRYLYVGIDGGNLIPQTPAETHTLRYGDCKAKTLMLLAMLHSLDVKAEAVLVHSTLGDHLPARLPSAATFDHVIVKAQIGAETLWLDGTRNGARIDDLADVPAFYNGLPLRTAGADLERIAPKPSNRPDVEILATVDQRAGTALPALSNLRFRFRGDVGQTIHTSMARLNKPELLNGADQMLNRLAGPGVVRSANIQYDAQAGIMTFEIAAITDSAWKKRDGRVRLDLVKTLSDIEFSPDRARAVWRQIPYLNKMREGVRTQVQLNLPDQGRGYSLAGDQKLSSSIAGVAINYTAELRGGLATLDQRIDNFGVEIPAAAIAAERTRVGQIKARRPELLAPENAPTKLAQLKRAREEGTLRPLIMAYGDLIAQDVTEAWRYDLRAHFYISIFDWKAALPDFSKAIELEASSVLHGRRSYVYEQLGRDKEALADAEAALSIDAEKDGNISRVAHLMSKLGRRAEAIAMLEEQIALSTEKKRAFASDYAWEIGRDDRADEAIAFFDDVIKSAPGNGWELNNRCWLKARLNVQLDTALKDCSRGIELVESPAAIYDSRALVYYRMGRYAEALADANAALELAPEMTVALFIRALIKSKMGDATAVEDLAAARTMLPRIDDDYAEFGVKF